MHQRVILVNMEISVILGHEKTKIRNIIDYGKIDVFLCIERSDVEMASYSTSKRISS